MTRAARRGQTRLPPALVLSLGAVCISFSPIFVKWVGEDRLGPTSTAFWRCLFGAAALFVITAMRSRTFVLSRLHFRFAVLAASLFALDLFFWHRSILYVGAGLSTILGNTQVFGSALLSWMLFKERPSARFFIAAVSAMLGVVLLVGVFAEEVAFSARYTRGIVFGLLTGLTYAGYIISLKGAGHRARIPDGVVFMAWVSLLSAVLLAGAVGLEASRLAPPDLASWLLLAALGIVAQAIGWWAISRSLREILASKAGLILLLQPALATVWGVLFFAEQMTLTQAGGAVITLAAIYYGGWRR
ncbi:MAG: EamA family transporter [Candidatus Eisenbacteria bacterium]|nr:EamA family transporter [Candidatus Latescibacterota bacterium]MBD3302025.1 EamA family transporter [Candidatus Eisenbacteria bacterium]